MKKVTFVVREPDINRVLGNEVELVVNDGANIIDVIRKVDELILQKSSSFPVRGCRSLLQLVFHPTEHRFYSHAALTAYSQTERFLDVRANVDSPLPDGAVVVLVFTVCGGEWERVVGME